MLDMKAQIALIRAIGSEFFGRKINSVMLVAGAVIAVLLVMSLWLTTVDVWWWLLAVPVIFLALLLAIAYIATRVVIGVLRPQLSSDQSDSVARFVDKLERVADNLQTPMPFIVFQVMHDIIRPRERTFIQSVSQDSSTLRSDLRQLYSSFRDK